MPGKRHVLILGAGFAGLELATRLSASHSEALRVTLIDQAEGFTFGFSKLEILFAGAAPESVRIPYSALDKPGVEFRRERVTAIDPGQRRVETDAGSYEADILVVALGADYDPGATPGFELGGVEFYSIAGAQRMRPVIETLESGRVVFGILGHPFKCPPAPFEGALMLHDRLSERGVRDAVEIEVFGPMKAPVPIVKEVSEAILGALAERGIAYQAEQVVVELEPEAKIARLKSGDQIRYDLFVGVPVHRVPEVVESSGLAVDGWVPVDPANLRTEFDGVYAVGDLVAIPMAKAGVFAEAAAAVVAEDIGARLRGEELEHPYEGAGTCYIEFGGGAVGMVEANFLGGPSPTARLVGPSLDFAADKREFAASRRRRWFG